MAPERIRVGSKRTILSPFAPCPPTLSRRSRASAWPTGQRPDSRLAGLWASTVLCAIIGMMLLAGLLPLSLVTGGSDRGPVDGASNSARATAHPFATYSVTFLESGLSSATLWSVNLSGTLQTSTTASVSFSEPMGSYWYTVAKVGSKYPNPSSGNLTLNGSGTSVAITFAPGYAVTFTESGLTNDTTWGVTIGGTSAYLASSSITFQESNGSYPYQIGPVAGFTANPSSGTVGVSGASAAVAVTFNTSVTYSVSFTESGLPSSTYWNVTLGGSYLSANTSGNSTIQFIEPNGSYYYSIDSLGYAANASTGFVTVQGANATVSVTFRLLLLLVMVEQGLAPGTNWEFELQVGNFSARYGSGADIVSVPVVNGTYNYTILEVNGYSANRTSGTVTVAGASITVPISYALNPGYYALSVVETGLSMGTGWSVSLSGSGIFVTVFSLGSAASYAVRNGTYNFGPLNVSGYSATPSSGQVTVAGSNATVTVSFRATAPYTYPVTFVETGLPARTNWNVVVDSVSGSTTYSNMSIGLPNGTYPWVASATVNGTWFNQSGSVLVNGTPVTVFVTFGPVPSNYTVSFAETGLPSGTNWSVDLSGVQRYSGSNLSTYSAIAFAEPNGTHSYTVPSANGCMSTPSSGSLIVNGTNVSVSVKFVCSSASTYSVTFAENGLPAGTDWSVNLGAASMSANTTSLSFSEANGSYSWAAAATVNGTTANTSGTVHVSGSNQTVNVSFQIPVALVALTFEERGLSRGANWSVTLAGLTAGLTIELASGLTRWSEGAGSIAFRVSSGTYSYTVSSSGYSSTSHTLVVGGTAQTVPISFTPVSTGPASNSSGLRLPGWAAAIGVVFLLVGASGLALTAYRARSRRQERGKVLVARLAETQWAEDANGDPMIRAKP